jgi:hypothetical protein
MGWVRWLKHEVAQVVAVSIVFREVEEKRIRLRRLHRQYCQPTEEQEEEKDRGKMNQGLVSGGFRGRGEARAAGLPRWPWSQRMRWRLAQRKGGGRGTATLGERVWRIAFLRP